MARFTISDAHIDASGPAAFDSVHFRRCMFVWNTDVVGVIWMGNCRFENCTFLVDGMEVSWDEFCALTRPRR